MAIDYKAAGTAASGTGTVAPAWPTHVSGDIGLLVIHTYDANATLDTANGFTLICNAGGVNGAEQEYLTIYGCRATSASMTAPVVTDMGDHSYARIFTFSGGADSGDFVDDYAVNFTSGNSIELSTSGTADGAINTQTVGLALIVGWGADTATCTATSTLGTRKDGGGTATGTGGGFDIFFYRATAVGDFWDSFVSITAGTAPMMAAMVAIKEQLVNSIDVPLTTLTLTAYAPTVTTAAAGPFINVPIGSLTLTGYTPTVRTGDWFDSTDVSTIWTDIEGN